MRATAGCAPRSFRLNSLSAIGAILLFALLAGHLVKALRVPEVTGYIVAGVIVGPFGLGLVTHENVESLGVFSEVALGLILFSIGSVFDLSRFHQFGHRIVRVTAIESTLAAGFVTAGMLLVGQPWQVALLLGAISIETAAASTLMVIRECDAAGPLTETLTGIIAVNNILALVAFSVVATGIDLHQNAGAGWGALYRAVYPLAWQMIGSVALGFLVGLLLSAWASRVVEHGEILILLAGCVLLCVGVSALLGLSPLVSSLAVGATMVNLSGKSRRLFETLSRTDPPLYAIFFVIAGADLNVALLGSLGVLGVLYVIGRSVGKLLGAGVAAARTDAPRDVRRLLGISMLSQAGLAVGLILTTRQRFPELAPTITTVVLGAVTVFELVGPIATRFALTRSGEVGKLPPASA
ncbi:MAG TPA: cation:proton antiporter [Gemmatimonadales bacterium]|jgi:Kef-type K+ transport system membrane component KefB|nr:cation:proton antiporter [Gemmatimonadales bacterium]